MTDLKLMGLEDWGVGGFCDFEVAGYMDLGIQKLWGWDIEGSEDCGFLGIGGYGNWRI